MKLLPSLLEQSVDQIDKKLKYLQLNKDLVCKVTNQTVLSLCVNFIYPLHSMKYNLPLTISPLLTIGEAKDLSQFSLGIHANYLITKEELTNDIPLGNLDFVPEIWNINIYLPLEVYPHFTNSLGKIVKLGTLVFLSELDQSLIDGQKQLGCFKFSFYGRHLLDRADFTQEDFEKIISIVKLNQDCEFIIATDNSDLIIALDNYNNVQISENKRFWEGKII